MGIFSAIKNLIRAKDTEAGQAIEDAHRVSFAEQATNDIQDELNKARENLARVDASCRGIERNIAERKRDKDLRTSQAKELKAAGKEDLALDVARKVIALNEEIETLTNQLEQMRQVQDTQKHNVDELVAAHEEAVGSVRMLKATAAITDSTNALAATDKDGVDSALSRLNRLKERQAADLDLAQSRHTAQTDNLDTRVEAALGGKHNAAASELLASL